ncbi:MAG: hypothetical protein H0T76_11475 [Nannocystis sp.]|nr:hypothetical protein [Nannocystis sp.]MBA3547095.1 hypothetical protein [Nannocystis sp.]
MNAAEQALRALTPAALIEQLSAARWFGARGDAITSARLLEVAAMPEQGEEAEPAALTRVHVCFTSGAAADYQVPLALHKDGQVRDATQQASFCRQLAHAFARGAEVPTQDGDAAWSFEPLADLDDLDELPSHPGGGEQSNTSIVYGERAMLKLYRRLEPGMHPEVEICRFLTTRTQFRGTPPLLGVLRLRTPAGETIAGMLQAFVPHATDGWSHVLTALKDSAERCDDPGTLGPEIEALGRLTAELHAALGSDPDDPDFAPRPTEDADLQRWRDAAGAQLTTTLARLAARHTSLPADAATAAQALLGRAGALRARLAAPISAAAVGPQSRHHGDYHLGQVLHARDGWHIIDFEGEPARTLHERRAPNHPIRDLAGMLRSFAYVAAVAARGEPGAKPSKWEHTLRTAFLRGYDPTLTQDPERSALLALFETERLFYELSYELGSRPDWAWIPLAGIAALLP